VLCGFQVAAIKRVAAITVFGVCIWHRFANELYLSRPPVAVLIHEARRSGGLRTPEPRPILAHNPLPVKTLPSFRDVAVRVLSGPPITPSPAPIAPSGNGRD
jgi:hypothetical protein